MKKMVSMLLLLIGGFNHILAQGPGSPGDPNPDSGVPLQGGVALLLVMAATYIGIKVLQQYIKTKIYRQVG